MPFTDLMDSIRGWSKSSTVDGVRLAGPDPERGSIAIHQRVPLRPIPEMIREHAHTSWGAKGTPELGPATLFPTCEGEHACLVPVAAQTARGPTDHWIAVVIGDEHAVLIDGTAAPAHLTEMRERVHRIAEYYYLALGEMRRRKFEYQPPAGWNGLRHPTSTSWYHPGYPRQMAVIKVFDVRPAAVSAPDVLDRVLFIDTSIINDEPPTPPIACRTPRGLVGYVVRGDGTLGGIPVSFASAYFTDERFAYFMRLEAGRDIFAAAMPVLAAMTESIVSIPYTRLKASTTNLIHWAE
jgi:hypothetical protein